MGWNLGRLFRIGVAAWWTWFSFGTGWRVLAYTLAREVGAANASKRRGRAEAAYNASLKDRLEMLDIQPDAPRTLVLGRVRYVEGVRRRWTSGTHDEKLTMIVSFAGHEIDAFESWYLDDMPVTLDGSGWVQEAPYNKSENVQYVEGATLDLSGGAVVVLPATPANPGAVSAVWTLGSGELMTQGTASVAVVGATVTVTGGDPLANVYVHYTGAVTTSHVRIRPYLGEAGQNVGAAIVSEYTGKITASDAFAGIALAVVDITYNPDIFPQGRPTVTAVLRGAKCYDPRTTTTVWTENPALHALKYATWTHGWALGSGEYVATDVWAAADVCDVSTSFPLSTGAVTLPRHRCGITIDSAADHAEAMDAIMETMNGRHGWAGGKWRMRAGTLGSTAATITQEWLVNNTSASGQPDSDPVITAVQALPRTQRINRVTGSAVDPAQRYQLLPFPAVEDAVLIAAHGERAIDVQFSGVNHIAHAQHLASMAIRQAQAGLRVELTLNEYAARLELFDVVALTMERYGFSAKTFEVVGWTWNQVGAYKVTLAEITAALFTVEAALTGRDPAPDSDLRAPWDVEAVSGLAVDSSSEALQDGSIIVRAHVTWTAVVGENIRQGGSIEVQYTQAAADLPSGDWPSWIEDGNSTGTVIPGLLAGRHYLFRVRAVQNLPLVRGPWSASVLHKMADLPGALLFLGFTGIAFVFQDADSQESDSPTISIIATLQRVTGTATFATESFNSAGASLGTGAPLGGSGNTRTLSLEQFLTYPTTYTLRVTATIGSASDTITIYRVNNGTDSLQVGLSNTHHILAATSAGVIESYTGAEGELVAVKGGTLLTDVTVPSVTFSMVGYTGFDTTYPAAQSGISISATYPGMYAVTGGIADDVATVTFRATLSTGTTEDRIFRVTKSRAGAAALAHRLTTDSVLLPVNADGIVSSWATAVTEYIVEQGATEVSADWTFSKEDFGIVSALSGVDGNELAVTAWESVHAATWPADIDYTLPTGGATDSYSRIVYGNGVYIKACAGTASKMLRSTNYGETWAEVTMPSAAAWTHAVYNGSFWLVTTSDSSDKAAYSVDNGATWTASTLPTSGYWTLVGGGSNGRTIVGLSNSDSAYYTDNGSSFTATTLPASKDWSHVVYGGTKWVAKAFNDATPAISTDNGVTWANGTSFPFASSNTLDFANGLFICRPAGSDTRIAVSTGLLAWTVSNVPGINYHHPQYNSTLAKWLLIDYVSGDIAVSADTLTWEIATNTGTKMPGVIATGLVDGNIVVASISLPKVKTVSMSIGAARTGGYADITASKSGQTSVTKRFNVSKGFSTQIVSASAYPFAVSVPSTSDGLVTDYTVATTTVTVLVDGVDDSTNWTYVTEASTGVTISGANTRSPAVTAMTNAIDSGYVTITASQVGYQSQEVRFDVTKARSAIESGVDLRQLPSIGFIGTYIAIRFVTDGAIQVKKGAGAWTQMAQWYNPLTTGVGATGYWLKMTATGTAFTSGDTVDTYLELTSDRTFEITKTTAGTYTTQFKVYMDGDSSGASPNIGIGLFELTVPP